MIPRPNAARCFVGVLSEIVEDQNNRNTLIIESGILGGDLIPRAFLTPTLNHIRDDLDKVASETEDQVDLRPVGSVKFGAEQRAVFGDIDCIIRMEKPETLSRIKEWAVKSHVNVRDIASRASGKDLNPQKLGNQFSFLYPIYKADGQTLTIGELRAVLQARHGQTDWKTNHDERLRVASNLENLNNKSGTALVQVDIMKIIVDNEDAAELLRRAKKLEAKLETANIDNKDKIKQWLQKVTNGQEVEDFDEHYDYLRDHGEMQTNDDQSLLAAIYYLNFRDKNKGKLDNLVSNTEHRYSYHPDSLQLIYFLAKQVGMPLDDTNFSKQNLEKIIQMAIQAGVASDKLNVGMLRDPNETFKTLRGKFKQEASKHIMSNTKNKRSDEHNPDALWKNYGKREIKRI